MQIVPAYLQGFEEIYARDPREAARRWLAHARYGLFLHFGLYSLLGRHEWVQFREKIRPGDYAGLKDFFKADHFDAEKITSLAEDAGMTYVCLTAKHHDSFCLWDTQETGFNSVQAPCGRDLVAELAEACRKHNLGLCLYYSHGRDWRHPHGPDNENYGGDARPAYDPPEPTYAYGDAHDLNIYLDFMKKQITELLTNYGPIAAIWLDGIAVPKSSDTDAFKCEELYQMIRSLQSQVLISYKSGLTGTEDYFAPEEGWSLKEMADKRIEVCAHMSGGWGYTANTPHKSETDVWNLLRETGEAGANLLLNTGPLPDGSIDPADEKTLRAVGDRLRKNGFPEEQ